VVIATRDVDGCVEVTVSDRGCGFGGRDAQALFQSFVTTKPGGLGLGLSISRSIVQAHGGTLAAASRPGGGAVFTLRLPALAPRPAAAGAAEASRPLSHSTALA
jgi:signal transduction histidine kinase